MSEYITQENKEALEAELLELTTTKRKEIIEAVEYAKSLGDLSENAEYHSARENQAKMMDRIHQIENVLKHAVVVEKKNDGYVHVGSEVVIQKTGESNTRTFQIVGSEETDMMSGKISYKSPLGNALLNKKINEKFTIQTPKGEIEYILIKVS